MLSNSQFAAMNKVPATLEGDMADFALFTLDMGGAKAEVGRTPDGKRIVKRLCPHLRGKDANLWDVTPRREGMTATEFAKFEAEQTEQDRLTRLELYASRGWAFEQEGEEVDDDPPEVVDEWERFFADDDTPRGGSGSRRRSGVRNNSAFEGFVDAAQ